MRNISREEHLVNNVLYENILLLRESIKRQRLMFEGWWNDAGKEKMEQQINDNYASMIKGKRELENCYL